MLLKKFMRCENVEADKMIRAKSCTKVSDVSYETVCSNEANLFTSDCVNLDTQSMVNIDGIDSCVSNIESWIRDGVNLHGKLDKLFCDTEGMISEKVLVSVDNNCLVSSRSTDSYKGEGVIDGFVEFQLI